ncbi:Beta-galactosidase BoGH2A [Neonectria ditissima]|uniref:Beta-galactosidase BoGH2A n=1 Tax=Neonectria ditissima TaxID=78410 RepID=A0A0P7BX83_9HYPO|nr:Beta-galactosidase BoGH2A [Neonectria ditissima]
MPSFRKLLYKACELSQFGLLMLVGPQPVDALTINTPRDPRQTGRERININSGWKFWRSESNPDGVIYDHRSDLIGLEDAAVLKPWILPSGNAFITNPTDRHELPNGSPPGGNISFAQGSFDDSDWESVKLPHDWAIQGPFYTEENPIVGGGMGRLPVHGVGWYRRKLTVSPADKGKSVFLDIDGAMSYAMVWLNGHLVGGWPYGYNSFRLDLTPHLKSGDDNQLAIRLDNPTDSARWYPGGGLYRSVWLTKVESAHVAQWGTYIVSKDVSDDSATLDLVVEIENKGKQTQKIKVETKVHVLDSATGRAGKRLADFPTRTADIPVTGNKAINASVKVKAPRFWGPPPTQKPNLYVAVTTLYVGGEPVDTYETQFGIRQLEFNPNKGLVVNGELIRIQGVNEHHDFGALGAAFNLRAAERKLETLRELGVNAIRMSHNPPAPELLQLTDRMGFLVIDEIFDSWELSKTASDFHLIFPDWHEPDLRAFVRRDRNHASIIAWSFGNEVGEQHTDEVGAALALSLHKIVREEDPTRPNTASMNFAKPDMPFGHSMDILSINYQGSGIRDTPNYSNLAGIRTKPLYPDFHSAFPDKMILSSETASTLSTRGTFFFPVDATNTGAPVNETSGGNSTLEQVSAYELYTAGFGSPPDKVWTQQDKNPYVAGEFVWTGFDYIGEPTPYYTARSSYSGIIDLAGFKKERYYLYQSRWRPDVKMAHIIPHWNWPSRVGKATPVHVFSAADEAELFVNGKSQGRIKKKEFEYRFRWDEVVYKPGELRVVAYKNGQKWVEEKVKTTGKAVKLRLTADRKTIGNDGTDLSFITVEVVDKEGTVVPTADNSITFSLDGPGEIVATDNGNPADMVAFPSLERRAFGGLALAIFRGAEGSSGRVSIKAEAKGLPVTSIKLNVQ